MSIAKRISLGSRLADAGSAILFFAAPATSNRMKRQEESRPRQRSSLDDYLTRVRDAGVEESVDDGQPVGFFWAAFQSGLGLQSALARRSYRRAAGGYLLGRHQR